MSLHLKKTAVAAIILSCNSAFAGTMGAVAPEVYAAREGLYAGVGVGGAFDNYTLTTRNLLSGFAVRNKISDDNVVGNAFLGYGRTFDSSLFLGAEVGTVFPTRTGIIRNRRGVSVTASTFTNKLSISDYVTLDLLPGFRPNSDWLVYARVGASFAQLQVRQPLNLLAGVPSFSAKKDAVGGRFGAGVTYTINQHFGAALDYYYTTYQTQNAYWPQYTLRFKNTAYSNFVGLSLVYTA